MIGEAIDSVIGMFSPQWRLERHVARMMLRNLDAGTSSRVRNAPHHAVPINPNAQQSISASNRSRQLFLNDPRANKAARFIASKVIGCGMKPQSLANLIDDNKPWDEFRSRAEALWAAVQTQLCYDGRPGRGGMSIDQMAIVNLNETIVSGDGITREIPISVERAQAEGRILPLTFTLYSSQQLAESEGSLYTRGAIPESGHTVFRGIEFDANRSRVAYHLYRFDPHEITSIYSSKENQVDRIEASLVIHTYLADFPGMVRGITWLNAVYDSLKGADELAEYELMSQKAAACVMGAVMRRRPGMKPLGLNPRGESENIDQDGNATSRIQPGLILNLNEGDDFKGFNPNRNASDVDKIASVILRGAAAGIRGMKASAITQDYERGSFSSEKAADNDIWAELELLQEWYADSWYQQIYERVIATGIAAGWFDELSGVGASDSFRAVLSRNIRQLSTATWQGPVPKFLQPASEESAAHIAMGIGTSNPQLECASRGYRWRDVADGMIAYWKYVFEAADKEGIPRELVSSLLSAGKALPGRPQTRDLSALFGDKANGRMLGSE